MLVLDSGGLSYLAKPNQDAAAIIRVLVRDGLWPPLVPSVVLAESVTGRQRNDANVNRFLKTCDIVEELPEALARRAGSFASAPDEVRRWGRFWSLLQSRPEWFSPVMTKISRR